MKRTLTNYLMLVALALIGVFIGCGKKEKEEAQESPTPSSPQSTTAQSESPTPTPTISQSPTPSATSPGASYTAPSGPSEKDMAEIAAKNAEALKAMNQGKDIQPVSTDTIKGFLPDTLAGMKQSGSDARQMGMMGINVSTAQADYEGSNDSMMELTILDLGNISGPMRMGMTGWTLSQYDRKTDTGYEKTTTYKDYKALEEYDNQARHGEFHVFAGDRFVVEIKGDNVTMETIKQAMDEIDLKKLVQTAK
ncbi:MAG: hypothetical protein JXM79_20675 [Sedimentisphaerales bacterium]|nr:hypothetical protein [Sedimentisphaerales bacterium]